MAAKWTEKLWCVGLAALVSGCGAADEESPESTQARSIEVLVDNRGIPHIYAESDEDLFFGYGYQLARDRLLQLEMYRRSARGTRAAILGATYPGAIVDTALTEDRLIRTFNIPRWGREDAQLMKAEDPERWKLIQAWVGGINKFIKEVNDGVEPLPFGFGPDELDFKPTEWTENDPFIVQKVAHLALDLTLLYEVLLSLLGDIRPEQVGWIDVFKPVHDTFALPKGDRPKGSSTKSSAPPALEVTKSPSDLPAHLMNPDLWGIKSGLKPSSNNWAIDGRHTDNGMPLLAGDPHLAFNTAGVMYGIHLNSIDGSGTFDVGGFAFCSAPGIALGQTRGVAWTPTSAFADVMDMWSVEITDKGAKIGDQVVPLKTRTEVVDVRDGSPIEFEISEVPGFGVIFPPTSAGIPIPIADMGEELMVGWTGMKARTSRWFLELNRAMDLDEFDAAALRIPEMTYNWVAADQSGITYRVGVEVPQRHPIAAGREPWQKMDASDPKSFWKDGRLSADQLPHSRATEQGYIVTANNDPFGFTQDGDPTNDPFYYGAFFDSGWRAHRITSEVERLTSKGGVTLKDVQSLQMDVRSNVADDVVPIMETAFGELNTDDELQEFRSEADIATLVDVISAWDRNMAVDSSGAVAFHAFMHHLSQETLEDDVLPIFYDQIASVGTIFLFKFTTMIMLGRYANGNNALQESRNVTVLRALKRTTAYLTDKFGGVDGALYKYGDVKSFVLDDGFGMGMPLGAQPTPGGESSINVSQNMSFLNQGNYADTWTSSYGSVARITARFDDDGRPETFVNFPIGNVADPSSRFFDNAGDDWVSGSYEKFLFERAEVEANLEERRVLSRE